MRRTLLSSGLLWLSLSAVLVAGQSATGVKLSRSEKLLGTWKQLPPDQSFDPFVGFWRRNWHKSDASLIKYAAKGDVFTITATDGITDERQCDGKDHPNKFLAGLLYSCGFPDEHTYELVMKDNGKVVTTISSKISEDGKKMARTVKNGEGKATSELKYEKVD